MQPLLFPLPPRTESTGTQQPPFNVAIVYEDFDCGVEAMKLYQEMDRSSNPGFEFSSHLWRFDLLAISTINEMAADQATEADMVIVSLRGETLPPPFLCWLKAWTAKSRGDETGALVVLHNGALEDDSHPSLAALRSAAEMNGRQFFAQKTNRALRETEIPAEHIHVRGEPFTAMFYSGIREIEPVQHWGLNE
jgi:hypothetical protein